METIRKKEMMMITLMIFSLFFGAGNLIFPPIIGKEAGSNTVTTMMFFALTAIVFPILAVVAVSQSDGLKNLAARVDPVFSIIFTIAVYLSIGPALAIPRAGSVPFEIAVAPYLSSDISLRLALFVYTTIFFLLVYWLSLNPGKLLGRIGKITAPVFLILICMLFIGTFIKPMGMYMPPVGKYKEILGIQGFIDGYMTLDAIAGLNYGLVVVFVIKSKNIHDKGKISRIVMQTGIGAGLLLFIIYMMLAHIGASSASLFPATKNGAEILSLVANFSYGRFGAVLLAGIFTIACLNIGVGLTTSISQYFSTLVKGVSYKMWVSVWVICSYLLANMGLNSIMAYSVPVLQAIYPASLVLIVLALADKYIKGSSIVYRSVIYPVIIVSILNILEMKGISVPLLTEGIKKLPLYRLSLGWISVAAAAFAISYVFLKFRKED